MEVFLWGERNIYQWVDKRRTLTIGNTELGKIARSWEGGTKGKAGLNE